MCINLYLNILYSFDIWSYIKPLFLLLYFLFGFLSLSISTFSFSLSVFSSLFFLTSCFLPSPFFSVHGYPFLHRLPSWNLPLLSLNHFWLLMGISLGLPTIYKCVGCTTPYFQKKLLVLLLTSLYFCFTSMV